MFPNFLIIGTPKCASTSLHFYLSQHPEIYMSHTKEIYFFSDNYDKGLEFYRKYFLNASGKKAIGEATPVYCFLPYALDRIKQNFPDIKLILCLRNPVERAFSNWLMLWDAGVEKASFIDAININLRQLNYADFNGSNGEKLWKSKPYSIEAGEKWLRTYLEPGMYGKIFKELYKRFKPHQIKYIFIEDLKTNFDGTIQELFSFLEVEKEFKIPKQNEQNFYYDRKIYRAFVKILGVRNTRFLSRRLPKNFKTIFKQQKNKVKAIPSITAQEKLFLWDIYKDDIEEFESITGKNVNFWKPNYTN